MNINSVICHTSHFNVKRRRRKRDMSTVNKQFIFPPGEINFKYYLGQFTIGITNNILPTIWTKCTYNLINDHVLFLEFYNNTDVLIQCTEDIEILLSILKCNKTFCFSFHQKDDTITLKVYLQKLPLSQFDNTIGYAIKMLFHEFFNINYNKTDQDASKEHREETEINTIYAQIRKLRADKPSATTNPTSLQHELLIPILRPYQLDAVQWMIKREEKLVSSLTLHPLYIKINLQSDTSIYYASSTGYITKEEPLIPNLRTGGILADEMGLGKTVEVLACILNNPCAENIYIEPVPMLGSESEESDSEDDVPLSQLTPTKRTFTQNCSKNKKIKLENKCENVPKKKMSETKKLAQEWYEKKLQEVHTKPNYGTPKKPPKVQCTCGESNIRNTCRCKRCKKRQHLKCTNYDHNLGPFYCAQCWQSQPSVKSKATLIVCPPSLIKQWEDEIKKHVKGALNIFKYLGYSMTPIYPTQFQQFDIVLTTYSVLQYELILVDTQAPPSLRRPLKYAAPGCSIANVHWWRLCLDEAQMVESSECMVSTMAKRLKAEHRWAITGTPITRNVQDLFGLLDYLDIAPYNEFLTWKNLLYIPYCSGNIQPMLNFLEKILWRTAKTDVLDQICIPQQTVKEYKLEFSHVEQYYYNREHEHCSFQFFENVSKFEDQTLTLASLHKPVLKKLLTPLLSLRQACVHPHRGRYLGFRKKVTNMAELLEALIAKNKVECEENLRAILASHNGIAGILLLQEEPDLATEEYRKSFELSEKYKTIVNVDKLQRIHLIHNLVYILETYNLEDKFFKSENAQSSLKLTSETSQPIAISERTAQNQICVKEIFENMESNVNNEQMCSDINTDQNSLHCSKLLNTETNLEENSVQIKSISTLQNECLKVEHQYMERFLQQTLNAFKEAKSTSAQVDEIRLQFEVKPDIWYTKLMDFIETNKLEKDLMRRVENQQENFPVNKVNGFTSTKKILYSVTIWNDHIQEMQIGIKRMLENFLLDVNEEQPIIKPELIENAMECHIRSDNDDANVVHKKKKRLCLLCISNSQLKKYESLLFNTTKRGTVTKMNEEGEEVSNIGNWKPSAEEILLKIIHQTAKSSIKRSTLKTYIEDGKTYLQLCFFLRKEFKALRKLWTFYNSQIQAQDELNMCKMRMQLRNPNKATEPKKNKTLKNLERQTSKQNPLSEIHHLCVHELHYQRQKLEMEKSDNEIALNKGLGTQGYLETLKNQQKSGGVMDPCPVCRNALDDEYAILQCGHWYCLPCIDALTEQSFAQKSVICCVCRQKHKIKTVAYIRNNCLQQNDDGLEKIEGDLSTKIEAIVRLIRDLKTNEPQVKVLVFSNWSSVLKILYEGLIMNEIQGELVTANADLQKKLPRFKNDESGVTVLLLPIGLGSKGLNIIEATHVIFMEPVLDPGDEHQAIGRVHRIGQTKQTTVHKFIVQNTIEANVFQLVSSHSNNWDKNKLTIAQLRDLFTETI